MFPLFIPFLLLLSCQTVLIEARRYSRHPSSSPLNQARLTAVGDSNVHSSWPIIFLIANRVPYAKQLLNLVNIGIPIMLSDTSLDGRAKGKALRYEEQKIGRCGN